MNSQRLARLCQVLDRRQPDLTVVMDGVHKPLNFAAVLRTCDAVGMFQVHGVWTAGTLMPEYHASRGTGKWLHLNRHQNMPEACARLKAKGFNVLAAHVSVEALDYRQVDYTRPTALLLGGELHGFDELTLGLADQRIYIPMQGMVESLNVSVAAATILFEAQRQRLAAGLYDHCRLDPETYRRTLFEWAQPKIAEYCQRHGQDYPELTEHGEPAVEFRV
jgi:tRNA (guanosine-2'-O-)-methyltransferase